MMKGKSFKQLLEARGKELGFNSLPAPVITGIAGMVEATVEGAVKDVVKTLSSVGTIVAKFHPTKTAAALTISAKPAGAKSA